MKELGEERNKDGWMDRRGIAGVREREEGWREREIGWKRKRGERHER